MRTTIDCAEFKNYLRMIQTACDRAAQAIDGGDSKSAEKELQRIERLLPAARKYNGGAELRY